MEITERGISNLVAQQVGISDSGQAEATCHIMQTMSRLEGVTLQRRQLLAAASVGASMRVFDDSFDECPISAADRQGALVSDAVSSGVLIESLDPRVIRGISVAQDNFSDTALIALKGLASAQVDSVRQRRAGTPVDIIRDITRRKGAYTILLFALEVNPSMSPERRACYEELGYLVQLVDDYVDRYLDEKNGISTLMTLAEGNANAVLLISAQVRKVKTLLAQQYSPEKLTELFGYIDRLLAGASL